MSLWRALPAAKLHITAVIPLVFGLKQNAIYYYDIITINLWIRLSFWILCIIWHLNGRQGKMEVYLYNITGDSIYYNSHNHARRLQESFCERRTFYRRF